MTAPTPEQIEALGYAAAENIERGYAKLPLASNEHTLWLINSLEESNTNLRASVQMHEEARALLDQTLTERDQARQMLADAPHADICYYRQRQGDGCNCWKAGL